MNKMMWIALCALIVIGVSFEGKRIYDQHLGASISENNGHATNSSRPVTDSSENPATNPNTKNGGAIGTNGVTSTENSTGVVTANGNSPTSANPSEVKNPAEGAGNPSPTAQNAGDLKSAKLNSDGSPSNGNPGTMGAVGTSPEKTASNKSSNAQVVPEKPKDNCFAYEYRHKKDARNQDIENFLDYTNAFPITRADYNPKSLCVKVNSKAVNFQVTQAKNGAEVRVGSMVGPESVIRVSYCVGKVSPCHETCAQPKKRFMDDLMSDSGEDDSFADSWGKDGDEKNKKELKEKSKELRAVASENDHLNDRSIQREWDELEKQEWVCK